MATIALATLTIWLKPVRRDQKIRFQTDELPGGLAEEFRLYAVRLQAQHQNDRQRNTMLTAIDINDDPETGEVWGWIDAGAYGRTRMIRNSDTNAEVGRVGAGDAVTHPFFFLVSAANESNRGVLILERHGNAGIQTAFMDGFRAFFNQRNPSLRVHVHKHVPLEVIEHLRNGRLKAIEYRSYSMPAEIDERVKLGGYEEGDIVVTTRVTARRKGEWLPMPEWVRRFVGGRAEEDNLLEAVAPAEDLEQENISLTFTYKNSQRTVQVANPNSLVPYIDVTEAVGTDADGHANRDRILAEARRLKEEVYLKIGRA